MQTVNEVIEQAIAAKVKHGYNVLAVIYKSFYSARKFSIGFHFEDGLKVGYKGVHASGDRFEVLAIA